MKSTRFSKMKLSTFAISAVALAGCTGGGPGDEQDLSAALNRDDTFTVAESDCIAERVFAEYGDDETALQAISDADDIAELDSGENSVEGFSDDFETYVQECAGAEADDESN